MLSELMPVLKAADKLHAAGFAVWLGVNTSDNMFGVSVSKHPYKYGEVEQFTYNNMKINSSDVLAVARKLQEVNGIWEQGMMEIGNVSRR